MRDQRVLDGGNFAMGSACAYAASAYSRLPAESMISPPHPRSRTRGRISSTNDEATTSIELLNAGDLASANASSGLTIRRVNPTNFLPILLGLPSVQISGSRPIVLTKPTPALPAPQNTRRRPVSRSRKRVRRRATAPCNPSRRGGDTSTVDAPLLNEAIRFPAAVTSACCKPQPWLDASRANDRREKTCMCSTWNGLLEPLSA